MTALDIVHGRRGGRQLPRLSAAEQEAEFQAAIAAGRIVRASCLCTWWWSTPAHLGARCRACDMPMRQVKT